MLRQSEPERRRMRDDAESSRARWERYEAEKQRIVELNLDPDDYAAMVMRLAEEMGL